MKKKFTQEQIEEAIKAYKATKASVANKASILFIFNMLALMSLTYLEAELNSIVVTAIIIWVFFSMAIFKHKCVHCTGEMRFYRHYNKCPHCKIPFEAKPKKIKKYFLKTVQVMGVFLCIVGATIAFFRNDVAALFFLKSSKIQNGIKDALVVSDSYYRVIKADGVPRVMEDAQIIDNYDSSTWVRIGVLKIESKGEKFLLMFNYDSGIKPTEFVKDKQEIKCIITPKKKTLCIPASYIANEESFMKANSLERTNEYIKQQFAKM